MNPIKSILEYIKNDWKKQTTKEKILTIISLLFLFFFLVFVCWGGNCGINNNMWNGL